MEDLLGMAGLLRYIKPQYYPDTHPEVALRRTIDRRDLSEENEIKVRSMISYTLNPGNRHIILNFPIATSSTPPNSWGRLVPPRI